MSCGSVVGRLVDKGGHPVPGVRVSLQGRNNGPITSAETDPKGRFRVELVPGRKYWFGLFAPRRLLRSVPDVEVEPGGLKELGDLPVVD
jgi:hypothetical protein